MSNEIEYCFAEISFANGMQYGVGAFGDEAEALREETSIYLHRGSEHHSLLELPLEIAE
jgi:hypothetical protein